MIVRYTLALAALAVVGCGGSAVCPPAALHFTYAEEPPFISYATAEPAMSTGTLNLGADGDFATAVVLGDGITLAFEHVRAGFVFSTPHSQMAGELTGAAYLHSYDVSAHVCDEWAGTFAATTSPDGSWTLTIDAECGGNPAIQIRGDWASSPPCVDTVVLPGQPRSQIRETIVGEELLHG